MTARQQPTNEPSNAENLSFCFTEELYEWTSTATSWFFIRMPADQSAVLREEMDGLTNGFGSVRVEATIGDMVWKTSVFPESASKTYMLPVKKSVRRAEEIEPGDSVEVRLRILLVG
jgi:hypothetical protein